MPAGVPNEETVVGNKRLYLDMRHAFWHNIPAHKQDGHLSGLLESYQGEKQLAQK